jgi:cytochrome b
MIKVWSVLTRLMHWTLVSAFIVAFYTRDSELMRDIHVNAGYVAGIVLFIRWIYGFVVNDFAAFRRFPPNPIAGIIYLTSLVKGKAKRYIGHNPAGALAVYGMLILGVLTTITGYMSFNDIPLPFGIGDEDTIKDVHNQVAYAWFVLVCLHVTGVIAGSIVHRENLPLAMITGKKKRRLLANVAPQATTPAPLPDYVRRQYIEETAYYIAERRGFHTGQDWDDWLNAEKEVDRLYYAVIPPDQSSKK